MGIGGGILLAAVGAILRFAVDVSTTGFNVHTAGVILMVAGAAVIVLSLMFWGTWGGFHHRTVVEDTGGRRVIDDY